MSGIDIEQLPLSRALNLILAMAVDDVVVTHSVQTDEKRVKLFSRHTARADLLNSIGSSSVADRWDPETWGTLPEHQAAAAAVMAFAGPPALPKAQP